MVSRTNHVDHDELVLIALGEQPDQSDRAHLNTCLTCAESLATLSAVVGVGRDAEQISDLPPPPPRVWQAIAAATSHADFGTGGRPAASSAPSSSPGLTTTPLPHFSYGASNGQSTFTGPVAGGPVAGGPVSPRPLSTGPDHVAPGARGSRAGTTRPRRRRTRWAVLVGVAAIAAAIGVGATIGVNALRGPTATQVSGGRVEASTDLSPQATPAAGASGTAQLVRRDGTEVLRLTVRGMPAPTGYYEVWLFDPDANRMIAIGVLGATGAVELPVPPTVDPARYRIVDISAQALNGDPAHGQSMLRGTLGR